MSVSVGGPDFYTWWLASEWVHAGSAALELSVEQVLLEVDLVGDDGQHAVAVDVDNGAAG